jgi:hypothetical protein
VALKNREPGCSRIRQELEGPAIVVSSVHVTRSALCETVTVLVSNGHASSKVGPLGAEITNRFVATPG